jgi:hypothetical protein
VSTPKSIPVHSFIEPNVAIEALLSDPRTRRMTIRAVIDDLSDHIGESFSRQVARHLVKVLADVEAADRQRFVAEAVHNNVVASVKAKAKR